MNKSYFKLAVLLILLIWVFNVNALYIEEDQTIDNMGHAIRIKNLTITPNEFGPGDSARIDIILKNSGRIKLDDLVVRLNLPSEFKFDGDVNKVKVSRMLSLEEKEISFDIVASPTASEGIYDASLIIDYVSYIGANYVDIGEQKQDNYTFNLFLKGNPNLLAQIEKSEVYKGNDVGVVTIKFVNNGVGNIRFLTIELMESEGYEIISSNKDYIGDLDSDDFESVDFRIKVDENKEEVPLLTKVYYRDSLNKEYEQEIQLPLTIREAKELGIKTNGTSTAIIIIVVIAIISYLVYNKFKKKKKGNGI